MRFFLISQGNGEGQLQEVSRPPRLQHQRRALLHHVLLDEHLQETGEEEGGFFKTLSYLQFSTIDCLSLYKPRVTVCIDQIPFIN